MKKNISQAVFEKINKEKITIKPKYYFIFCSIFWLFLGGLFFFLGSALLSLCFYFSDKLKPMRVFINNPFALTPLLILFFLLLVVASALFTAFLYRKSRSCCRHEDWMLRGSVILGIVFLSFFAYFLGVFENTFFVKKGEALVNVKKYWSNPNLGTLSGEIDSVYPENKKIILRDWSEKEWAVQIDGNLIKGKGCRQGDEIKMIGEKITEDVFFAKRIWSWE
ncbi:MAG: hypothetical protein PHQ20_00785 [Candidatus Moranbacteria bacterium]|nr:hypothetical protein [Candidatus Moranbacteria bacterium]